jgi:hypothetical protein
LGWLFFSLSPPQTIAVPMGERRGGKKMKRFSFTPPVIPAVWGHFPPCAWPVCLFSSLLLYLVRDETSWCSRASKAFQTSFIPNPNFHSTNIFNICLHLTSVIYMSA